VRKGLETSKVCFLIDFLETKEGHVGSPNFFLHLKFNFFVNSVHLVP
jgi:hypothetical protein